ncbi:MAG: Ig-like domain-containing protein [Acholeplasmataceae bacterium]
MKKHIKNLFIVCLMVLGFLLTSCTENEVPVDDIVVRGIGFSNGTLVLSHGDEVTLAATVMPTDSNHPVEWTSNDVSIATVSKNGVVKGVSVGETKIKIIAGKFTKEITVVVNEYIPISSISFPQEELEVEVGIRKQLDYTIEPSNATYKNLIFSVEPSNAGVKVSSLGIIEVENGLDGGSQFTITAKSYREQDIVATITLIISTYVIEDIKLVENDFYTEITEIIVPLDEPYRVIFPMVQPEKALSPEEKLDVLWTSDNEAVCTVNEKGRLLFHSEGTANITMSSNGIVKTVPVTVGPISGNFIEEYYIPQLYIDAIEGFIAPTDLGWVTLADFRGGGTGAADAKQFVFEKYKYATGPSSWFAGGGYCVEMGGWDNIHSGLEDDDMEGGGYANLFMWTKVKLGSESKKLRAHFQYRQTDATFKYKLRFTFIDPLTKEVFHLSDWQIGDFKTDPNLAAGESFIEADIPEKFKGKTVLMLLEYDDIDYPTDGILNGVESVNIKYFTILNYDGQPIENSLWVLGDSIMTEDFTGSMLANIANEAGYTLFRDTISGSTIAPASSIGMIDHIDSNYYENSFGMFGTPKVIAIQRGTNDVFWSNQPGNALKLGDVNSTDKTTTYGAIRYTINYFMTKYPGVKIIWSNMIYRADVELEKIMEYNNNLTIICAEFENVEVFDLYTLTGINASNETQYLIDGIHPSNLGKKILTNLWIQKLKEYDK